MMKNQKSFNLFKKYIFSLLALVVIAGSNSAFNSVYAQGAARAANNLKFGILFFSTLQTSLEVTNKDTNQKASNYDNLAGIMFFFEKIFQNYFGYEARFGLFNQDINMKIDGIDSNIANNAQLLSFSMRTYAQSHRRNGVNFYGAVNVGLLNSNLKFTTAPAGTLQGKSENFSTFAIGAEGGADYIIRFAGVRGAIGYQSGSQSVGKNDTYKIRYDLGSPYFLVGVFSFF